MLITARAVSANVEALTTRDLAVALGLDDLVAEKAAASLAPSEGMTPLIMSDVGGD
jgi:hypothetical protein